MNGLDIIFSCPSCKFTKEINIGETQFIKIKGHGDTEFVIRKCPSCGKKIAFKFDELENMRDSFDEYPLEDDVVHTIVSAIYKINEENINDQKKCEEFVLNELKKSYKEKEIERNYEDLIIIFVSELLKRKDLLKNRFCLDDIDENDIKIVRTIHF